MTRGNPLSSPPLFFLNALPETSQVYGGQVLIYWRGFEIPGQGSNHALGFMPLHGQRPMPWLDYFMPAASVLAFFKVVYSHILRKLQRGGGSFGKDSMSRNYYPTFRTYTYYEEQAGHEKVLCV
ncbi:hypothetical protein N7539_000257 [Penicillium diatomitis]|uniref:Uncharacterized protein n=1 Tax=Penicillium diatomitis TaxID=2819901 RepID=A0A9W9XLC8_9EURO|nr:uncharacterized protein N7539_000257 [Penicillium diatomitis]KAJ5495141.1 hypothetical protein N7539_000257 [Penicillium diatomitis]